LFLGVAVLAQNRHRHRVVLLERPTAAGSSINDASLEVLARLRGELTAAGFEVVWLPADEGDPGVVSETAGSELHPAAVIYVLEKPAEGTDPHRIELWLSDRLSRRTFMQTLRVESDDSGHGYRRLAIQAVELLKARLAELQIAAPSGEPPPAVEPAPEPPPVPEPPPAPEPPTNEPAAGGRLAGGVALFQGLDGAGASFAPRLRGGGTIPAGSIGNAPLAVDIGATLAGLGTTTKVRASGGEASVNQGLGTIDVAVRFDRGALLQPVLVASAGAYTVNVEGHPTGTDIGHEERTWSVYTSGGAGVWLQPTAGFALELEGQLGRAWKKTVVRMNGIEAADVGAPLVVLSASGVGVF
jgi:hypothetical protein